MSTLLIAFGLMMLIEGLAYALAPSLIERMLEALRQMPEEGSAPDRVFGCARGRIAHLGRVSILVIAA